MPRVYCDVHGTPMFMQQHFLACTTNECDRISLDGKTCTSRADIDARKRVEEAINERMSKLRGASPEAKRAVERLCNVLAGASDNYGTVLARQLRTMQQKIAFLRQTDSLFEFPEESLGSLYFPPDDFGKVEVNHLRAVHARSKDCIVGSPNSFLEQSERVVRIASKERRKVFRWSGPLLESTVGIGCCFQGDRVFDMLKLRFHEWCRWHEHWWTKLNAPEDPMHDCDPDKEWRHKDLFIVPNDSTELIIKAMGASALVVDQYCWFLNEPLESAEKHTDHMQAVIQANKWLIPNGIIAGYKPRKKEQAHVTLLKNYLGGKTSRKNFLQLPKTRRIEF